MFRVQSAYWLPAFERRLPFPIPAAFRHFLNTCEYLAFEAGGIAFFPNTPREPDSLSHQVFSDPVVSRVTLSNAFLQIGRPDTGSYDPICLTVSRENPGADNAIVLLDHEELLMNERIVVASQLFPSFQAFLDSIAWA